MRVGIVGGGHTGLVYAAYLGHRGHQVSVLVSHPDRWKKEISLEDQVANTIYSVIPHWVGNNYEQFMANSDIVLITLPVFALDTFVSNILSYASPSRHIFVLSPGSSAREFYCKPLVDKQCEVLGLQRVVFISRASTYGVKGILSGIKDKLYMAYLGVHRIKGKQCLKELFNIPIEVLPSYLPISLHASNPILHSSRIRTMAGEFGERCYETSPLFYREWDSSASELFFSMDKELQAIGLAYKELGIDTKFSLAKHYDSVTPEQLTEKITTISAFENIGSPMIKTQEGYKIDLNSRYITEDILFGLKQIGDLGKIAGVECPIISSTVDWAIDKVPSAKPRLGLEALGISQKEDIIKFYS